MTKKVNFFHIPVLLNEVIEDLAIKKGAKYIDATLGGGGHAFEIAKRGGSVLGIDQDREAISNVKSFEKLTPVLGNFGDIGEIARENGFEKVQGILFDLGMSSFQIEGSGRGFSFMRDEPLDMRMGQTNLTAKEIINKWNKQELYDLFSKLGEEKFSVAISDNIVRARGIKPIETTGELVRVIEEVKNRDTIHPATRVFQALRMAVNSEIDNLKRGLDQSVDLLEPKGRILVISFHSGEDRVVKLKFLDFENRGLGKVINKKPITASFKEEKTNPRSRSAKLRIFERN